MNDRELQSLVEFSGEQPVLSVYLDTDLAAKSRDAVRLMFRDLARKLGARAAADVAAVQRFLDYEYDWQSRGVAVFASGKALWQVLPLPVAPSSQAWYAPQPYVRVLTDIMDRFGCYSIALIDRESVRLFAVSWGKIHPETEALGEELKRHRSEGWYAAGYQRHEDMLALRNLRQAADLLQRYCQETDCKRLMLGGHPAVLAQFRELAPRPLLDRLIGEFSVDMTASSAEVLHRSLDIVAQADQAREERLVEAVITAAAKGGAGTIGAADTLAALHQGRVRVLLVEESLRVPGYVCAECGFLSPVRHSACPMCKGAVVAEAPDVANLAIHKAVETGAEVNVVRQSEELLKAGGIAA
ncbi:MAG: hypothetical protein V1772_02910, partial [Chloroflexota bacterium]